MTDKSCPKRVRLVERLARAMNRKKRVDVQPSPKPEKISAEQELREAIAAVRTNPAEDLCGSKDDKPSKHAA